METQTSSVTKDAERFIQTQRSPNAYVVLLGLNVFDLVGLMKVIEKGLPWKSFMRLVRNIGLPAEQVAEVISVPKRTLARRKVDGRFRPDESDRLLRAARVFSAALRLYGGDRRSAAEWLSYPNWALGGISPLVFAQTEIGAQEVEHLVGRIEHGIFS